MTTRTWRTDSRFCPHPYCARLHAAMAVVFLVWAAAVLVQDWRGILAIALSAVLGFTVVRLVHGRSYSRLAVQEHNERFLGVRLPVRPGWARLAALLDAAYLLLGVWLIVSALRGDTWALSLDARGLIALAGGVAGLALYEIAHRNALRPRKTKTVPAAATAPTSAGAR